MFFSKIQHKNMNNVVILMFAKLGFYTIILTQMVAVFRRRNLSRRKKVNHFFWPTNQQMYDCNIHCIQTF